MNTIATFFAGIMAFVSGLFGHHVTSTSTSKTIVNQQVTSTSSIQTQATVTADNLMIYRDQKYGFELQYPKPIYQEGCSDGTVCLGMSRFEGDEMSVTVFGINVRNYTSLDTWYSWRTKEYKTPPEFKNTTIDNLPAKTIFTPIELYGKGTSCQLTGVLYQGKIFEICDSLKNEVTKKIIASISFPDPKSETFNSRTIIEKKFDSPEYIYTTKDNFVTYFTERSEKDLSPSCVDLHYLDTRKNEFGTIKDGYCPRSLNSISPNFDPKKILPLHIQEGSFNFTDTYNESGALNSRNSDLYVLNLETKEKTLLYSNNNPNESLIAGCYYIPSTYEFLGFLPYIEYTNNNQIKISVYKNAGQNSKPCKYDGNSGYNSTVKVENYEKIREDVVDLTKTP